MKTRVILLVKLSVAAAGFVFLLATGRLSMAPFRALIDNPIVLFSMVLAQVVLLMLGVLRWWLVLRAIDRRSHSYRSLLAYNWIGQFFGCFAPSAVATDITRAAYLKRSGEATSTSAVASLLIDRIYGICGALLLAGAAAWAPLSDSFARIDVSPGNALPAFLICAALYAGYRRSLRVRERLAPVLAMLRAAASLRGTIFAAVSISVIASALKVVCLWLAVDAATQGAVSMTRLFHFAPVGFLVEGLPIAPGGFGTAHLAFEYLFTSEGIAGGAAMFNVYFIIRLMVSMIGGLIWIRMPVTIPVLKPS